VNTVSSKRTYEYFGTLWDCAAQMMSAANINAVAKPRGCLGLFEQPHFKNLESHNFSKSVEFFLGGAGAH
jgi:hypothetical protein